MALDERDFFNEKQETRPTPLTCPRWRRKNDYQLRWVRRIKKDHIPRGADDSGPLRQVARLHDSRGRCAALPVVPHAIRSAVPPVARVPAGRRAAAEFLMENAWTPHRDAIF
jgi:hypothetical protein